MSETSKTRKATADYVSQTKDLVTETRKTREVQTSPKIYVGIRATFSRVPRELDITSFAKAPFEAPAIYNINLFIENIGLGPAYDITLTVPKDFVSDAYDSPLSELGIFKKSVGYLAPNQEISFFLTQVPLRKYQENREDFEDIIPHDQLTEYQDFFPVSPLSTSFDVSVDYYKYPEGSAWREKPLTERYPIDFSYLTELEPPTDMRYQYELLMAIRGIQAELAAIRGQKKGQK